MSVPDRLPPENAPAPYRIEPARTDWFAATPESEGLPYYLAIIRSNIWFVLVTVAVCAGAALLYLAQAQKVYEADADLLITPLPRENVTLIGLGLPRESSDPVRDVQTIARLIETTPVARRVVDQLRLDMTSRELLDLVSAVPVAGSSVVSITARADDPQLAARIANAFGNASVDYRTERLHEQLDSAIPRLRRELARLRPIPINEGPRQIVLERLRDLEGLRAVKDPTLRLETSAEVDTDPVSPRPVLSLAAAIVAGLLVGGAAALGSQLLDPRLRREEQLRRYRIPIVARIPLERSGGARTRAKGPLLPSRVSASTHDAYLLLAATLSADAAPQARNRSVLVTGPSSGDGKTTTALNLSAALAESERVVLVESDSRRPMLARVCGTEPKFGLSTVVARRIALTDALMTVWPQTPRLQVLAQKPGDVGATAVMTPASADWLMRQAHQLASWVVVDAPPLSLVPDALPFAKQVDDVILVVRVGNTRLKSLESLAELLVQQGITPTGFVVIGGKGHSPYYGV